MPLGRTVKTGLYRITDRPKHKYDQEADWLSKWNNAEQPGTVDGLSVKLGDFSKFIQ
jgi:hypothetical protein